MKTKVPPNPVVDELYQKIRGFVRRRVSQEQDQEELVQEIFLKFKKNLSHIQNQDRLIPWLYRTASHQIIDYYRTKRSRVSPVVDEDGQIQAEFENDNAAAEQVASWLQYFVTKLKTEDRQILQLIEFEGRTQKEAAELLRISLAAAKSRHQRAKQRLKTDLEACCQYFLDARGKITAYQSRTSSPCNCNS